MALAREVWLNIVEDNLFTPALQQVQQGIKDDSAFVYSGGGVSTVHIPNAGTKATVTKGNDTYPVAVTKRTDSDNSYSLSNYEVGPVVVQIKDGALNSYEQTESILKDATMGLGERVAAEILIGQYHYTSGLYRATTGSDAPAHAPGGTGNRKSFVGADLRAALGIMDKYKVPQGDRFLFIDSVMYWQLMTDLGYSTYRADLPGLTNGTTNTLFGVQIIMMPSVVYATTAGVIRDYGNAGTTTDMAVALLVAKSCTSMAMTDIYVQDNPAATGYFGGTYEATIMAGGKYRRTDKYGVVPIIQIGT